MLHLVGYLYYWQMGFNSVFKGLRDIGCIHMYRTLGQASCEFDVSATLTAFESVHFIVLLNLISSVNTRGA